MKWSLISIYLSIYISTTIFADIFLCTNIFSTLPSIPKPTNNLKKNLVRDTMPILLFVERHKPP